MAAVKKSLSLQGSRLLCRLLMPYGGRFYWIIKAGYVGRSSMRSMNQLLCRALATFRALSNFGKAARW